MRHKCFPNLFRASLTLCAIIAIAPHGLFAGVVVTNGDFEASGTNFSTGGFAQGVPGWGERNNNSGFPAFSDFLIIGAAHGAYLNGQTAGISNHVGDNGYLYQEVGTADGQPTLQVTGVNFWRNDSSNQHGPLAVAMYWLPSTDGFAFAELGNDILGVGTLINSFVVSDPVSQNSVVPFSLAFDVSSLSSDARLFLRFDAASTTNFAYVDNVAVQAIPEPSTLVLTVLALLGLLAHNYFRGCNPKRWWQLLSAVLVVSLSIPAPVHGDVVTMDAQSRSVVTGATADAGALFTDDDLDSAANFDPFNSLVMSTASSDNDPNFASASGEALQDSTIGLFLVEATGETNAFASLTGTGTAIGEALSDFSYTFTIDSPFFFTVLGAVDRFGPVSDAGIELVDTDTMAPVFAIGESVGYASTSINTNGILDAGTYELIAFADTVHQHFGGGGDPTTAGAEFELSFTLSPVPEPSTLVLAALALLGLLAHGHRRRRA